MLRNNSTYYCSRHLILWWSFLFANLFPVTISQYEAKCPEKDSNGYVPGPGCTSYFICANGQVVSPITDCQQGTLFDEKLSVCDYEKSKWSMSWRRKKLLQNILLTSILNRCRMFHYSHSNSSTKQNSNTITNLSNSSNHTQSYLSSSDTISICQQRYRR